jgi:hypothetical protein
VRHLKVFIADGVSVDVVMTADVTCSCGAVRRWYPGQEAWERLFERRKDFEKEREGGGRVKYT